MTEERFYTEGKYVMQDGEVYVICSGEHNADVVATALNELLDENKQLKETIKELELENAKHIGDGEWDIRDITYGHGKFRLEEWGERYHQFYEVIKERFAILEEKNLLEILLL